MKGRPALALGSLLGDVDVCNGLMTTSDTHKSKEEQRYDSRNSMS